MLLKKVKKNNKRKKSVLQTPDDSVTKGEE